MRSLRATMAMVLDRSRSTFVPATRSHSVGLAAIAVRPAWAAADSAVEDLALPEWIQAEARRDDIRASSQSAEPRGTCRTPWEIFRPCCSDNPHKRPVVSEEAPTLTTVRSSSNRGFLFSLLRQLHTTASESNAFSFQPEALFHASLCRKQDFAACSHYAVPWYVRTASSQRPHHLPGRSTMSGFHCDFAVRHYATPRNTTYNVAKLLQLHFAPVISLSLSKNAFFRAVSSPQFTGGD
jgi:hypothetical protein